MNAKDILPIILAIPNSLKFLLPLELLEKDKSTIISIAKTITREFSNAVQKLVVLLLGTVFIYVQGKLPIATSGKLNM